MTTQDTAGQSPLSIDDVLDEFEKGPVETKQELPEVEVIAEGQDEPAVTEEKKEPGKPKDDPLDKLRKEVEALRLKEAQERHQREQYARFAAQKAREAQAYAARAQTSDYDLASNALDAATDKMTSLEQAYASAFAEGDGAKAASIQKNMSILGARITMLEDVKSRLEHQAQVQKQRAQVRQQQMQRRPQPQQHADPFEASIAHFSDKSKEWLRENREYASPEKWDEVLAAHYTATGKMKLKVDSPEYFEAIEKELGLREAEPPKQQVQTRKSLPAAPVSRGNGSGGKPQIRLSVQEQSIAREMGLTNEEYAIGKDLREKQKAQMRVH